MTWIIKAVRTLIGGILGVIAFLASFGLLLTLLWFPETLGPVSQDYKVAVLLLSGLVGVSIGGLIVGALSESHRSKRGGLFGLLTGLFSSAYILGPAPLVLLLASLSAIAGAAGGRFAQWRSDQRPGLNGRDRLEKLAPPSQLKQS